MATIRARPTPASQAENARRSIGADEKLAEDSCRDHRERAMKSDNIIPSKHKRAERRWVRWKARPESPRRKVDEKANWAWVIRLIMEFHHKFLSRNQMFCLN